MEHLLLFVQSLVVGAFIAPKTIQAWTDYRSSFWAIIAPFICGGVIIFATRNLIIHLK